MSPFRRGKVWWTSIGGRNRSLRTKVRAEAVAREAELRNSSERARLGLEVRDVNPRGLTMCDAVGIHLDTRAKKQAGRDRLAATLDKHIRRDPIGRLHLEQVTSGVIVEWLDRREAEGASATTCNRLRAYLSSIFGGLIERELWRGENPVRRVRLRRQQQPRSRLLPADVVPDLLLAAPTPGWHVAFALAAYAGLRRGEIERLQWADVDLVARILTVRKSKTGVARTVAIHRELAAILEQQRSKAGPVARAGWGKSAVIVRTALARAGLEVDAAACFHSLRHTWATRMIDCGADPWIVQFMGWGPPRNSVMATSYTRPRQALIDAVDKLWWPTGEVVAMETSVKNAARKGE